jgi:hypothetical protein
MTINSLVQTSQVEPEESQLARLGEACQRGRVAQWESASFASWMLRVRVPSRPSKGVIVKKIVTLKRDGFEYHHRGDKVLCVGKTREVLKLEEIPDKLTLEISTEPSEGSLKGEFHRYDLIIDEKYYDSYWALEFTISDLGFNTSEPFYVKVVS